MKKITKTNKLPKIKKHLNYRTLLKVETILSFAFAVLFISARVTGFSIENSTPSNLFNVSSIFLLLGILGALTLLLNKNKLN